jgi:hypothetical protein
MTQSEYEASYLDYSTESPVAIPGQRVLLACFVDDGLVQGESLSSDISLSYNMDPVYVYSENWVARQVLAWQSSLDNEYLLQEGYGESIEKRDNFHKMIMAAIRSCRAVGARDIWISICGPEVSYDASTGAYSVHDSIEILGQHMRAIQPDVVVFVNKDTTFIKGSGATYPSLSGQGLSIVLNNGVSIGSTSVECTSTNRWNDLNTIFDEVGAILVVPAVLHPDVKWRSQYKPTPFDINNDGLVDGTDLEMLLEVDASVAIDTAQNDSTFLAYESWYAFVVYGDLMTPSNSNTDQLAHEYVQCAPAVGGLFTVLEDRYGFKSLIGKHLEHEDVWRPILEEDIDTLKDYRINPIRVTIRNGITLAGNHTFYGNQVNEDVNHLSFPLTRAHNVFLANTIGKEMEFKLSKYIGKSRPVVKKAIPGVVQSTMGTKPVVEYSYDIIDSDIDEIRVIIIFRVLNTICNITTTTTVARVK